MNIKNIWTLKFKILGGGALGLALLLAGLWLTGYRVNLTSSLPRGVYQIVAGPVQSGDLAAFCLESKNAFCELAGRRGYLGSGSCPSGLRPLLKHLVGLPGDRLEIRPEGIVLNARLLTGTARPTHDRSGRSLPPSSLKAGLIPEGQALVLSQDHSGSFDSRHFGLVPLSSLQKVRPIFIFKD